jgi:SAM-dependent methyltransferase
MAHYMLYHVPDKPKALAEIWRVLKPGGRFFAVTLGEQHILEIFEIMREFDPSWSKGHQDNDFTLENGGEQITSQFPNIELRNYKDSLEITETEPLIDYILSMSGHRPVGEQNIVSIRAKIETQLAQDGVIRVQKHSGMFVAQK